MVSDASGVQLTRRLSGPERADGVQPDGGGRWHALAVLAVLSAAANMASPLYPLYLARLDISPLTMTLLYATYAAVAAPSLLLFGPAADAWGRRPVMAAGVGCAAAGAALFAVAGTVGWLFVGRGLLGVALGLATGAGVAVLVERAPSGARARASLLATLAFVGGTGAGPLLTGVLAGLSPAGAVAPFVVVCAVLVLTGASLAWFPEPRSRRRRRWRPTRPRVPDEARATFALAAASGFLGWTVVGVFLALLPSVARAVLAGGHVLVSGVVVAALLLCSALTQPLAPRLVPHAAQTVGTTLLVVGLGLLVSSYLPVFSVAGVPLVLLVLAAVAGGAGHGLSYWGAAAELDARTVPDRAGVTAALYLVFYLGAGLPAVVVGLLTLAVPLETAVLLLSLLLGLAAVLYLPVPALARTPVLARGSRRSECHLGALQ